MVNPLSATVILHKIANNDVSAFEDLFDKYAPAMLGAIQLFVKDKAISEKILENLFIQFQLSELSNATECGLLIYMYKHTIHFTMQYLKQQGLSQDCHDIKNCPRILQMIYEKQTVKKVAFIG